MAAVRVNRPAAVIRSRRGQGHQGKKTRNNKRTDRWIVRRANKRKDRQVA